MSDDPVARFGGAVGVASIPPIPPSDVPSMPGGLLAAHLPAGEILTPEQLLDYARELARSHVPAAMESVTILSSPAETCGSRKLPSRVRAPC